MTRRRSNARESDDSFAEVLRREHEKARRQRHEKKFDAQIRALKLPPHACEYRFMAIYLGHDVENKSAKSNREYGLRDRIRDHALLTQAPVKDWRFDFAFPSVRVAVEIEGAPGRGRHTTGKGFTEDIEKYTEATILGWHVLRFTGQQVASGYAINSLIRFFKTLNRERNHD